MSSIDSGILLKREKEKEILRDLRQRLGDYVTKNQRLEDELFAIGTKYNTTNNHLIEAKKIHKDFTEEKEKEISELKLIIENQAIKNSKNSLEIKHLSERVEDFEKNEKLLLQLQNEFKKVSKANELLTTENSTLQEQNESYRRSLIQLKEFKKSSNTKITSLEKEVQTLEKIIEQHGSIKEKTINELIQRKEEELKSAYEGWSNETDKSLKKIETSLKEEHEKGMRNEEKKLQDLKKRYSSKCKEHEMLKDRFLDLNKEMETKIKQLASRYRFNVSQWEKKANSLEDNNENLSDILKEEQTRFHEFMNSKVSYDAELLHIKDILDGEELRAGNRKRRYSDLSPDINNSISQNEENFEETKALSSFSPNIIKSKMVNGINIFQKSALQAVKSVKYSVPSLFKGYNDINSNEAGSQIDMKTSERKEGNPKEINKRYKTINGYLFKAVASEHQEKKGGDEAEGKNQESLLITDVEERKGENEDLDISLTSINDSHTIMNGDDNNSTSTNVLFSPNPKKHKKAITLPHRSPNLMKKATSGTIRKDIEIDIIDKTCNSTKRNKDENITKGVSNVKQNRRSSVESTISQITLLSEFNEEHSPRTRLVKKREKSALGHQCSWEEC